MNGSSTHDVTRRQAPTPVDHNLEGQAISKDSGNQVPSLNSREGQKIPKTSTSKSRNTDLVQKRLELLKSKQQASGAVRKQSGVTQQQFGTQKLTSLEKEINLLDRFCKCLALLPQLHAQQNDPEQGSDQQTQLGDMRQAYSLLRKQSKLINSELEELYRSNDELAVIAGVDGSEDGEEFGADAEVPKQVKQGFAAALKELKQGIGWAKAAQQRKADAVDLPGLIQKLKEFNEKVEECYSPPAKPIDYSSEPVNSDKRGNDQIVDGPTLSKFYAQVADKIRELEKIDPHDLSARNAANLATDLRKLRDSWKQNAFLNTVESPLNNDWVGLSKAIGAEAEFLDHVVGRSPLTKSKMYQAKQQMVQAAINALQSVKADLSTNKRQKLQLEGQIANLQKRCDALGTAAIDSQNQRQLADPAEVIGRKPLDSFLDRLFRGGKVEAQRKALESAIGALMADKADTMNLDLSTFNEQALMEGVLQRAFAQAGLSTAHDARDLYRRAHGDVLNKNPDAWGEIKEKMTASTTSSRKWGKSTRLTEFTNVIRPARKFGGQLKQTYKAHDLRGINSHCTTEYRHAVNFAKTETLDANGNKVFSAYRAATLSAYQITPEQMRKMPSEEVKDMLEYLLPLQAEAASRANPAPLVLFNSEFEKDVTIDGNQLARLVKKARTDAGFCAQLRAEAAYHRAREIVTGMVQDRLRNEPELVEKIRAGETTIEDMCITSMSLLTPDMINLTGELRMQGEQFKAWERIRQEAKTNALKVRVQLPDAPEELIEVGFKNLQVLSFDFGVNSGAIGNTSWLPGSGGWNFADSHNAKGFEALFGKDGWSGIFQERYDKMRVRHDGLMAEIHALEEGGSGSIDLSAHRKKAEELKLLNNQIQAAFDLRQQIQQMWADKSYQDAGNEPYKMVSRLAVLGSLLGIQLVFNCKSGKDRTGETDAEAKYIASRIARGLRVHKPNDRLTDEEFRNRQWFVLRSGNHEMQAYNTGLGGYKLSGVDSLYKQFHRYVLVDFLGLSAYTRS